MLALPLVSAATTTSAGTAAIAEPPPRHYADGRPAAKIRLAARDAGVVYRYGNGPDHCDHLGARDVWVYEDAGTYYMNYDGAGDHAWLACLATSKDLLHWEPKGPILSLGKPGEHDSASASYGVAIKDPKPAPGADPWQLFYLGTPNVSPAPNFIPAFPYQGLRASGPGPAGPWTKRRDVTSVMCKPGTYYSVTSSPGHVVKHGDEYLQFFSAATLRDGKTLRTIGCARAKTMDGPWVPDEKPIVPLEEQVENTSLYFEPTSQTWFLFTNHIGIDSRGEYTDSVWVYWTADLNQWSVDRKAVVLDGANCTWSHDCIGLPSVVVKDGKLAVFYDAPGGDSVDHMKRSVGLAWLDLPLRVDSVTR